MDGAADGRLVTGADDGIEDFFLVGEMEGMTEEGLLESTDGLADGDVDCADSGDLKATLKPESFG